MNLGEKIKTIRLYKGMKQSELADKASISRVSIGNYERGDRIPSTEILFKIAAALEVPVWDLLGIDKQQAINEIDSPDENNGLNYKSLLDQEERQKKDKLREKLKEGDKGMAQDELFDIVDNLSHFNVREGLSESELKRITCFFNSYNCDFSYNYASERYILKNNKTDKEILISASELIDFVSEVMFTIEEKIKELFFTYE
ncbi:helix-turn-helix domain-containing protein [Parasporobacterium paucivorans]|uniref:DNA-binding transcriptional regulator, XRE-family HTH domain n=1 Tax=Parasporobacterium paucivorans DSM 15970 TaxID=1122934 RepID=A0A1M6F4E8_9FIRM|nr:helix-turn-helix domain-containing protein [Parasporobacterium paucivorans]SHI92598.1 DNA-binding transcriptional regulator, XRE-family HTH domain [Parasporobacterium paucivorans DSM 15970]